MKIIAYPRGYCTNCGEDRGENLKCNGCGWVDPPTIGNKEKADQIRERRLKLSQTNHNV